MLRIGHKGADALVPGNTIASFTHAVEIGVDLIELDVLWAHRRGPLLIAHDFADAESRTPHTLEEVLEAFTRPPLDRVELNLDIKRPGREEDVVAAVREFGLLERAMASGLDLIAIDRLRALGSGLRLGWTVPKVQRQRDLIWARRPLLDIALARWRRRLPGIARRQLRDRGVHALWAHHALVSPELVEAVRENEVELMAWTVDDSERITTLRALGVSGICTNDPRLLQDR